MSRLPRLVTFDCAQTLVKVDWSLTGLVKSCTERVGMDITSAELARYGEMFAKRMPDFLAINLRRDEDEGAAFWSGLTQSWLDEIGADQAMAEPLRLAAEEIGFGPESTMFSRFDDVIPCLDWLDSVGVRLAVISNWDYSLHRVLRMLDLHHRFETVFASLEHGIEKPDPKLFHLCLQQMGVGPEETVHIGDDPVDDLQGAANAGMRAILIDRSLSHSNREVLGTLADLPACFS